MFLSEQRTHKAALKCTKPWIFRAEQLCMFIVEVVTRRWFVLRGLLNGGEQGDGSSLQLYGTSLGLKNKMG